MKQVIDDQFGGWPMVNSKENPLSPIDLIKRISKYKNLFFMSVYVGANPKNTKLNIIRVC
jgi:hypothetical protein